MIYPTPCVLPIRLPDIGDCVSREMSPAVTPAPMAMAAPIEPAPTQDEKPAVEGAAVVSPPSSLLEVDSVRSGRCHGFARY